VLRRIWIVAHNEYSRASYTPYKSSGAKYPECNTRCQATTQTDTTKPGFHTTILR
jgi:hypothetical protein